MYGSDHRGGGRGRGAQRGRSSHSRGKISGCGGGGHRRGPALPSALLRELGDDGCAGVVIGGRGRGRGSARGHGRRGIGAPGFGGRSHHGRGWDGGGLAGRAFGSSGGSDAPATLGGGFNRQAAAGAAGDPSGSKRPRQDKGAVAAAEQRPAKRQRGGSSGADLRVDGLTRTLMAMRQGQARVGSRSGTGPGPSGSGSHGNSSKTKFHELLVDGWESRNGREAFLEELRLQARLAKKLGKSKKDALDGMDKLMGLLSAGSGSMLPKYLDPEARREAEDLLTKAGSGSGSGLGAGPDLAAIVAGKRAEKQQQQQPVNAAAAACKAAELLDRESDEELEFFGIDPSNRDEEVEGDEEEEEQGMYGVGSDSGTEEDEGEEEEEDGEEEQDSSGDGLVPGSEGEGDDGMSSGGEDDEDDDDGFDILGHMMGSDSGMDEGAAGEPEGSEGESGGEGEDDEEEDGKEVGAGDDDSGGGKSDDGLDVDRDEEEDNGRGRVEKPASGEIKKRGSGTAAVLAAAAGQKYVPPALRAQLAAAGACSGSGAVDAARMQVERRVTGLVNRLAEANLQSISREVAQLYRSQGRRLVSEAVAAQILGAAESGPRASEQFAAVAAAFVAAVAAQAEAQDLAAGFLGALAERLEAARSSGDSLAQANLVTLLAYCYSAGLVGPGLCYSLLGALKERFQEADVSAMVTLLNAVGLQLRNSDPGLMKEFVLGVHQRAAQLGRDGQLSRRAQLMLDLIIDIKNNKTSAAGGAAAAVEVSLGGTATRKSKAGGAGGGNGASGGGRRGGALAVLQPSVAKWLQQIGVEEVSIRGLTWQKLMSPNKKGMWWMPVAGEALDDPLLRAAAAAGGGGGASTAAAATSSGVAAAAAAASTAKLLELAAAQRMNTDARRAVFVAVMGSEDCAEAHEKLLRLPLKGDQRREIMRVLVDCCLGEKTWNPYYAFLALRLCGGGGGEGGGGGGGSVGRAHRVTMQYCLWDKLKEVESMDVRQLTHLAKLAALLVARFAMSLSWLKVTDWTDLSAKEVLLWRVFLEHLLRSCKTAGDTKEIFARVASQPKTLPALISGLLVFLRTTFAPHVATKLPPGPDSDELLRRTRIAEKELASGASAASAVLI